MPGPHLLLRRTCKRFCAREDETGKKRSEWKTKGLKRSEKSGNPFRDILKIWFHYFSELTDWIEQMDDPRNTAYITYTQSDLVTLGIMKNICSVESMRGMDENFNEDECILNLSRITGGARHENMPDHGTLNYYLERLSPKAFREVRTKMIGALLRSRIFEDSRIAGMHWRVILDGTQNASFKERHCENCLKSVTVNDDGTKTVRYFHRVLEAKLVLAENIIISLDSEFIENESEDATKQDCEINASKRLLSRLKDDFPRLKICIQGMPCMRLKRSWKSAKITAGNICSRISRGDSGRRMRHIGNWTTGLIRPW